MCTDTVFYRMAMCSNETGESFTAPSKITPKQHLRVSFPILFVFAEAPCSSYPPWSQIASRASSQTATCWARADGMLGVWMRDQSESYFQRSDFKFPSYPPWIHRTEWMESHTATCSLRAHGPATLLPAMMVQLSEYFQRSLTKLVPSKPPWIQRAPLGSQTATWSLRLDGPWPSQVAVIEVQAPVVASNAHKSFRSCSPAPAWTQNLCLLLSQAPAWTDRADGPTSSVTRLQLARAAAKKLIRSRHNFFHSEPIGPHGNVGTHFMEGPSLSYKTCCGRAILVQMVEYGGVWWSTWIACIPFIVSLRFAATELYVMPCHLFWSFGSKVSPKVSPKCAKTRTCWQNPVQDLDPFSWNSRDKSSYDLNTADFAFKLWNNFKPNKTIYIYIYVYVYICITINNLQTSRQVTNCSKCQQHQTWQHGTERWEPGT